jgi:hypothetical protein
MRGKLVKRANLSTSASEQSVERSLRGLAVEFVF